MGTERLPTVFTDSEAEIPSASKFNDNFSHVNLVPWNLINNGDLELWANGANAAPDDWTLMGTGGSVARSADSIHGTYAAAVSYGTADTYLRQSSAEVSFHKGKAVKAWCLAKCSSPNMARLKVSDGVNLSASAFHSGSGNWEYLEVTHEVSNNATQLAMELHVESGGVASFDAAVLVDFADITGFLPSAKDAGNSYSPAGVAKLADTQTFTGANTFNGGITINGTANNIPAWIKVAKTYADFSSAAATNTITLLTLPPGGVVHGVKIKQSTAFGGGGITAYTISAGTNDTTAKYASPFNVFQTAADDTFQISSGLFSENHGADTAIKLTAACAGANLNAATVGAVDVWILVSRTI